jgi:protein phosphatase 2C family protein 2/3
VRSWQALLGGCRLQLAASARASSPHSTGTDICCSQKSDNGDGESLIFGVSSMQGWRISMEDAHATVLDYAGEEGKATATDKRLAFFGVYDGHGGDKVALYTGEQLHQIVAKQEAFKSGDIKKALQDGFLATDRAILGGEYPRTMLSGG